MKKITLILSVTIWITTKMYTQPQLPASNILTNTFSILTDTLIGTCFITMEDGEQYLITAKHLFKSRVQDKDKIVIS